MYIYMYIYDYICIIIYYTLYCIYDYNYISLNQYTPKPLI